MNQPRIGDTLITTSTMKLVYATIFRCSGNGRTIATSAFGLPPLCG
jgi:hypothetical protein